MSTFCLSLLLSMLLLMAVPETTAFTSQGIFVKLSAPRGLRPEGGISLSMLAAKKSKLVKIFNKQTLTISVDVKMDDASLSKTLRDLGMAAIFVGSNSLPAVAGEQKSAKGNFPGPVPVILKEKEVSEYTVDTAKDGGATALVLPVHQIGCEKAAELAAAAAQVNIEAMWEVTTAEEFQDAEQSGAKVFLVSGIVDLQGLDLGFWKDVGGFKDKAVLAQLDCSEAGNSPMELGQSLKAAGCKSVLLSGALDGKEDRYGCRRDRV